LRRLIINADDFGLTAGVNRAIAEAHSFGTITSTTLMANSPAFQDAVQVAAEFPKLAVGCHIQLLDGTPVLQPHLVPTLLQNGTSFRRTFGQLAWAVARNRINPAEVEAEATAQIALIQSAGIRVSHVDTHKHAHMFPSILKPIIRAAHACGVNAIRNPFPPSRYLPWGEVLSRHPELWERFVVVQFLRGFAPDFRRIIQRDGIATPDGALGVISTGSLTLDIVRKIIRRLPEGTWELVCHPGYDDADLAKVRTRLRESRAKELRIFTAPAIRELLSQHGVELVSFRELQREAQLAAGSSRNVEAGSSASGNAAPRGSSRTAV
jgi:hopanoid biosynthesis associated protein HpnK